MTAPNVPNFELAEDGKHVRFGHHCTARESWSEPPGYDWADSASYLPLDPVTGWVVVQTEPLTVTPSILCDDCGLHGFITNGAWVSA